MYPKVPYEAKYQLLINKREGVDLKHYNGFKGFTKYSNAMDNIYETIEEYNLNKEQNIDWI